MHRITENGDVRVQFPGKPEQQFRWTVNPAALSKVRITQPRDQLRICPILDCALDPGLGISFKSCFSKEGGQIRLPTEWEHYRVWGYSFSQMSYPEG